MPQISLGRLPLHEPIVSSNPVSLGLWVGQETSMIFAAEGLNIGSECYTSFNAKECTT